MGLPVCVSLLSALLLLLLLLVNFLRANVTDSRIILTIYGGTAQAAQATASVYPAAAVIVVHSRSTTAV